MKKISCILLLLITAGIAMSQPIFNAQGIELKHKMTDEEAALYKNYDAKMVATSAPTGEIRPIAEWEPAQAVLIRYPFGIPMSLIKEMAEDCKVITLVASTSQQNTILSQYNSNGVNIANCDFLIASTDSYWTRDYGPWFMAIDNQEVAMFDFTYNRPRYNDNQINSKLATSLGFDRYATTIEHCGGNFMNDGVSKAASTDLVLEENTSYSQSSMVNLFDSYMGINDYSFLVDPLQDYIKHIDCWGKFLAPNKVLIGQVPATDYRYQLYENVANYFANKTCAWGTKYQVYRVLSPGSSSMSTSTPFTNSLILNKKVFVPVTNSSYCAAALAVYQTAMPGYQIIPISYTGWEDTDALHCRTHEIADQCMLYVQHQPLYDTVEGENSVNITANVYSYCANAIDSVKVFVKQDADSVFTDYMMNISGDNEWAVDVPMPENGNFQYYITAYDNSLKEENHPYIGAADPHKFYFKDNGATNNLDVASADFVIYPNPVKDVLTVQSAKSNVQSVELYDITGKLLITYHLSHITTIEVSHLQSGIYFLKINGKMYNFIKQ